MNPFVPLKLFYSFRIDYIVSHLDIATFKECQHVLVDEYTRYTWIIFITSKNDTFEVFTMEENFKIQNSSNYVPLKVLNIISLP